MRSAASFVVSCSLGMALLAGCRGRMAKIEAIREALEKDDAAKVTSAIDGYPACADAPPVALLAAQPSTRDTGCFTQIASALGSKKGFSVAPPDQAAGATVAIVLLRDRRGDWIAHPEHWLAALKVGKGSGLDALRLAVARSMAEAAPLVGRTIEEDKDAQTAMKAVAGAIPGACPTYWLIGSGADPAMLAAEHSAEHSACVQKDLQRREGPGGSYGAGTFRALEGSLALWRETERALRLGLPHAAPAARATIEAKLKTIEAATRSIATKKLASNSPAPVVEMLGDLHADAGVFLWKDAGAKDGGAGDTTPKTP